MHHNNLSTSDGTSPFSPPFAPLAPFSRCPHRLSPCPRKQTTHRGPVAMPPRRDRFLLRPQMGRRHRAASSLDNRRASLRSLPLLREVTPWQHPLGKVRCGHQQYGPFITIHPQTPDMGKQMRISSLSTTSPSTPSRTIDLQLAPDGRMRTALLKVGASWRSTHISTPLASPSLQAVPTHSMRSLGTTRAS